MKIIIASTPIAGHLNPMLGLARTLVEDGHECVVYTGTTLLDRVTAVGAGFEPLPPEVDFDLRDVDRCFPARRGLVGADLVLHDFGKVFLRSMAPQYRGLVSLLERFPADMIVAEHLFYGVVPLLLDDARERPPVICCGISYLALDRDDGLPHGMGLPFTTDTATQAQYREEFVPLASAVIEPLQALYDAELTKLGIVPDGSTFSVTATHADTFLQGGVPELEYPRSNLPGHLRFVGSWPSTPSATAIPEWAGDLYGRRVVLVTQGTVANADLEQLILPTIRALADRDDVLVVATTGGRDAAALAEALPANARIAAYLPFGWLMPKVDVLVTNGGYGTVNQALAAGVPMVVAGTTEDKLEIAARVAWSGAGVNLKSDTPGEAALRVAIDTLLAVPAYRRTARQIAASFARFDPADILRETVAAHRRAEARGRCAAARG